MDVIGTQEDAPQKGPDSSESGVELGKLLFEWRDYTPIPLILILFLVAKPSAISATCGLLLMTAGELVRIYSVAFIGSVSRTRSDKTTGGSLISTGPFGMVRNPLYVGNFLLTVGIAIFGGVPWFVILTVVMFAFQYHYIVKFEENLLKSKFGSEYETYCLNVPRWFPKSSNLDQLQWPTSFGPALKSEKRTLTAAILMIVALLFISAA